MKSWENNDEPWLEPNQIFEPYMLTRMHQHLQQFNNMAITTQNPTYNELCITKQSFIWNCSCGEHSRIIKTTPKRFKCRTDKTINSRWTGFTHTLIIIFWYCDYSEGYPS